MVARTFAESAPEPEARKAQLQAELDTLRTELQGHRDVKDIAELTVITAHKEIEAVEAQITRIRRKIAIIDRDLAPLVQGEQND